MAEIKISELTSGSTLDGTEVVPIVQSGATVKVTTQDIADLGGGANPTSGVIPYNSGGALADSGFTYSGPSGFEKTLLEHNDTFATTLKLNTLNDEFTFGRATSGGISTSATSGLALLTISSSFSLGNASTNGSSVNASWGMALDANIGEAIIGVGMSSPSNGVFRASSASGIIAVGNGASNSIGYNNNYNSMHVGTNLIVGGSYSPLGAFIPVTDENGTTYYLALYM